MTTSSAISLTLSQRSQKRVLSPFSGAFLRGAMDPTRRQKSDASRGILAKS